MQPRDDVPLETDIKAVLEEFFIDLLGQVFTKDVRILGHDLACHAGLIDAEMSRLGMHALQTFWRRFAADGLCLMSPTIGKVVQEARQEREHSSAKSSATTSSYEDLTVQLLPEWASTQKHPTAAEKAVLSCHLVCV